MKWISFFTLTGALATYSAVITLGIKYQIARDNKLKLSPQTHRDSLNGDVAALSVKAKFFGICAHFPGIAQKSTLKDPPTAKPKSLRPGG